MTNETSAVKRTVFKISMTAIRLFLGCTVTVKGQQALTPAHYGQLRIVLNAATSLMTDRGEVSVVGRRQWVGMEGATALWGSGYGELKKIGGTIGLNVRHERLAVEKLTEVAVFVAKRVRLPDQDHLGVSLNAGWSYMDGRFSSLDPMDPAFSEDVREGICRWVLAYSGHSFPSECIGDVYGARPSAAGCHGNVFAKEMIALGVNVRSYGEQAGLLQLDIGSVDVGYGDQFTPRNEPLNHRMVNTTHELGLWYRFAGKGRLL